MTWEEYIPAEPSRANAAYDGESAEWIPFRPTSDALVAQLYLGYQIPPRYIDIFLHLLRRKDFKLSELSFARTTDIDDSVADFRKYRARERSKHYEFLTTKLPFDISLIL